MNEQQTLNAYLYLTSSALRIAEKANEDLKKLPGAENVKELPEYESSPLLEVLKQNNHYLKTHAFVKITNEGRHFCSREDCDDLITDPPKDTIILDFNDYEISLKYNRQIRTITIKQAQLLKLFLTESSKIKKVRLQDFTEQFSESTSRNTFIQNIRQLRRKLVEIGIPNVIETSPTIPGEETAYYYNSVVPYTILERVDEALD